MLSLHPDSSPLHPHPTPKPPHSTPFTLHPAPCTPAPFRPNTQPPNLHPYSDPPPPPLPSRVNFRSRVGQGLESGYPPRSTLTANPHTPNPCPYPEHPRPPLPLMPRLLSTGRPLPNEEGDTWTGVKDLQLKNGSSQSGLDCLTCTARI